MGSSAGCAVEWGVKTGSGGDLAPVGGAPVRCGEVGSCADGTECGELGWAPEGVVTISEALGALGCSVKSEVGGDPLAPPKDKESLEGGGGVRLPNNGQDHAGGALSLSLVLSGERAGGLVQGGSRVEVFDFGQDAIKPLWSEGDGGGDVVADDLNQLDFFLEAIIIIIIIIGHTASTYKSSPPKSPPPISGVAKPSNCQCPLSRASSKLVILMGYGLYK